MKNRLLLYEGGDINFQTHHLALFLMTEDAIHFKVKEDLSPEEKDREPGYEKLPSEIDTDQFDA